jgi:aminobenzoyl-glutamate transport protein
MAEPGTDDNQRRDGDDERRSFIDRFLSGIEAVGNRLPDPAILDPERLVNPLCNLAFTAASSMLVIAVGWYLTDRVIEPRLRETAIDGDPDAMPKMEALTADDSPRSSSPPSTTRTSAC